MAGVVETQDVGFKEVGEEVGCFGRWRISSQSWILGFVDQALVSRRSLAGL